LIIIDLELLLLTTSCTFYKKQKHKTMVNPKYVINFGHETTDTQRARLKELIGGFIEAHIPMLLDFNLPIEQQLKAISIIAPDLKDVWGIMLPGASILTAGVLVSAMALNGRLPRIIVMAKVNGDFMPTEVIDLDAIKNYIRTGRDLNAIRI